MHHLRKSDWAIPEREATPESVFIDRRRFLMGAEDKREVYYDIRKVVQARIEKFGNSTTKQLNEEQAELAKIRREILELELAERCGELVRVNEVRTKFFNIARTYRDSVLSIPSRLSSILAAETNERRVSNMLVDEITQSLKCLQNPYN